MSVCEELYREAEPLVALQLALLDQVCCRAKLLALVSPGAYRIVARILLLESLEACRVYAGEDFWRRCVRAAQKELAAE